MTLVKLVDTYRNESQCHTQLAKLRWPDGVKCTRCGSGERVSKLPARDKWHCGSCRYQFTAIAERSGTQRVAF